MNRASAAYDIGIEIHGGKAIVLIPAGSRTPCARAMTFTTVADGQRAIEIRVVRCAPGGSPGGLVGRFLLPGIPAGLRGEARIDIGISLDSAGLLRAWGAERSSGARQEACFAGGWALSPESRTGALAALFQRVDEGLDRSAAGARSDALRAERDGIGTLERETDCAVALATLAGEIDSMPRWPSGSAVEARWAPRSDASGQGPSAGKNRHGT